MKRSGVVEHVVLMPMRIHTQWEGDKLVAVMPAWHLPITGLMVEGENVADALDKLEDRMRRYWGAPSNVQGKGQTPQAAVPLDPPVGRDAENK